MTQLNAEHTALLPVVSCHPTLYCSNKKERRVSAAVARSHSEC